MAVEEIQEGLKNPKIPFVGDIGSIGAIVALVVGMVLWQFLQPVSDTLADSIANTIAQFTGFDLQQGGTQQTGGAFD